MKLKTLIETKLILTFTGKEEAKVFAQRVEAFTTAMWAIGMNINNDTELQIFNLDLEDYNWVIKEIT